MRRVAIGRIIGLLIAVVGVGISVWCARDAVRRNAQFGRWLTDRPMEAAIDLSEPGETRVPFHQTCGISHGEALYLECDLDDESTRNIATLFAGLSGTVVIKDAHGDDVETVEINSTTVEYREGRIMLNGFAPFREGEYVASIRVDSGAAEFAGHRQTIYAQYFLCGLEHMPAAIAGAFAFGAGLIGLVAAMCVLPGLLRCGIGRAPRTANS
ncbi:MAG: hypothetical protein MUF48_19590 [Pirellulaceae bacterium]|jgi:hypothetical protein|nr:hypothetical protein [Pirellulaceae bacterium]